MVGQVVDSHIDLPYLKRGREAPTVGSSSGAVGSVLLPRMSLLGLPPNPKGLLLAIILSFIF
jgi:hypothetical protein